MNSSHRFKVVIFLSAVCLLASLDLAAQQGLSSAPADISKWDLICFCITSVNTPHFAVRSDTNGRILYYAQNGATRAQLQEAMGEPVLGSQLGLPQDWRLLKHDGDVYITNIPVLGPERVGELREQMKKLAERIAPETHPEVEEIAAELRRRRLSDHLYSVLFSYVLDGLTWDELAGSKAIPEMHITADQTLLGRDLLGCLSETNCSARHQFNGAGGNHALDDMDRSRAEATPCAAGCA